MIGFDAKEYVSILKELKITPHQFIICWLIEQKDVDTLKVYMENVQKPTKDDIDELINRGFIIRTIRDQSYDIRHLTITKIFSDSIMIDGQTAFQELLAVLPPYMYIHNVRRFTLTGDREEQEYIYSNYIKNNKQKHEDVIRKTKIFTKRVEAGEEGFLGSEKYVKNRVWELIKDEDNNLRSTQFTNEI